MTIVYDLSLDDLGDTFRVDISSSATPCRYRLVDSAQFVNQRKLRINEFSEFPSVQYSTISYVWRGRPDPARQSRKVFSVAGAEEADPIAVDVLRHACTASIQQNISYIWLDRLCIMQTDKTDKHWQIREMYRIYQSCAQCIVLPGGLLRLVPLSEETDWIHRGWTLQEAIVPKNVVVLYVWESGSGQFLPDSGNGLPPNGGRITPVIPRESAITELSWIIDGCVVGGFFVTTPKVYDTTEMTPDKRRECKILGARTPNLAALAAATSEYLSDDARHHSIWQCALMRTSSRPIDMVFSIMGLFGVNLDPHAYGENDRMGATIALAKAILQRGDIASWLGIAFRISPSSQLSIFPEFPQTSVAGKAIVRTSGGFREVMELMDIEYPSEGPSLQSRMPTGSMDDSGYFRFRARCAPAVRIAGREIHTTAPHKSGEEVTRVHAYAADGSEWDIYTTGSEDIDPLTFAVFLGWFDPYYPGVTPKYDKNTKVMFVEEHAPMRYHACSFASLTFTIHAWVATWGEREFCVGGIQKPQMPVG
ncbi:hypothetical protein OBBRIDRAFT_774510 [Obba rivulosa]|uniref:Heterokaryon incompatibility domain-containing protein n=1 Tax=Obba rivulosa TaxID=1052685 RepID=A0A8E2B129_9APHY|nr:hypothetical protein OBBRIDRAFT_774510 [Obba rivulosa]